MLLVRADFDGTVEFDLPERNVAGRRVFDYFRIGRIFGGYFGYKVFLGSFEFFGVGVDLQPGWMRLIFEHSLMKFLVICQYGLRLLYGFEVAEGGCVGEGNTFDGFVAVQADDLLAGPHYFLFLSRSKETHILALCRPFILRWRVVLELHLYPPILQPNDMWSFQSLALLHPI